MTRSKMKDNAPTFASFKDFVANKLNAFHIVDMGYHYACHIWSPINNTQIDLMLTFGGGGEWTIEPANDYEELILKFWT